MTKKMNKAQETKFNRIQSELECSIHRNGHLTIGICANIARIALESTGWKSLRAARTYILRNRMMYVQS